jgi:hypothetical protein
MRGRNETTRPQENGVHHGFVFLQVSCRGRLWAVSESRLAASTWRCSTLNDEINNCSPIVRTETGVRNPPATTSAQKKSLSPASYRANTRQSNQVRQSARIGEPLARHSNSRPASLSRVRPLSREKFQARSSWSGRSRWAANARLAWTSSAVKWFGARPANRTGRSRSIDAADTQVAKSPPRRAPSAAVMIQTSRSIRRRAASISVSLVGVGGMRRGDASDAFRILSLEQMAIV